MNFSKFALHNNDDFTKTQHLIQTVFHTKKRIPQQVFTPKFTHFLFDQFDWAMSPEFWLALQDLAFKSKDSHVIMSILEPDPINYFFKNFGYYNAFKLPCSISSDDYYNILEIGPVSSPADAPLYNSEIVIWISPSAKWAIWGERSREVCILSFSEKKDVSIPKGMWRSVNEAIDELVAITFKNGQIPKEFMDAFLINYSTGIR